QYDYPCDQNQESNKARLYWIPDSGRRDNHTVSYQIEESPPSHSTTIKNASYVRQVLHKGMKVLVEVGVLVG
ncbi:MAG: hypothetical protein ACKOFH_07790, partial [Chthoniobacterales bacterium]